LWWYRHGRRHYGIDTKQVAQALETKTHRDDKGILRHTESGDRVAAIMPVYTLGTPADMEEIIALSEKYGLPIIADAAYDHDEVGYNYRMTNIEAAVGCAQLDRLQDFVEAKQKIRRIYDAEFADVKGISPFPYPDDRGSTCWFSGFVVDHENLPQPEEICAKLGEQRIQARIFWKPVHMQVPYADTPMEICDYSEDVYKRIVTLPCSTQLSAVQQARVINAVKDILSA